MSSGYCRSLLPHTLWRFFWVRQFPCQPVDHQLVRIAVERSERFAISYWDAAILAAAEALGAETVYSEGLSDGQRYGRVRVVNPFA